MSILKMHRMKRISSLDGLKAIMMLSIFCWHTPPNPTSPLGEPAADLGARACEVLIVAAGFLVACRHYDNFTSANLRQSWNYVTGKIARVWPVHFIAFLVISVYLAKTDPQAFFSLSTAWKAVVNLCLLQAWSSDPFSFNAVAWFVSALMFCYFMSQLLMTVLKKSRYVIAATFAGCAALRIILELVIANDVWIFSDIFHVSPIIRCMEFFMGMLMVPAYNKIKSVMYCRTTGDSSSQSVKIMLGMTVAELLVSACYLFVMYRMEGIWIRGYFVLAACVLVFTYALNAGALSRVLSLRIFSLFAMIQMEFYLFHQVIIRVLGPKLTWVSQSVFIQSVILFFITLAVSVLYKCMLKEKCTEAAKRFLFA